MSPIFLFAKDLELICEQLDHIAYEVEQKTHESTCTQEDERELWQLHEQITKASQQLKESIENG